MEAVRKISLTDTEVCGSKDTVVQSYYLIKAPQSVGFFLLLKRKFKLVNYVNHEKDYLSNS